MKPEHAIGYQIKSISNLMKRRMYQPGPQGFTEMLAMVIAYLYTHREQGDLYQRDIEAAFSIRRSTATGILQLMEKKGYLIREPVAFDARLKRLVLTPQAVAVHEAATQEIQRTEAQMTKGLTEQELQTLLSLLDRVKHNLEEHPPESNVKTRRDFS